MAQPRYSTPNGSQISSKPVCERLPAIVDNCAHSRLLLMVMEYYFMSGANVGADCECPMMHCRMLFNNARDMIKHLKTCDCLYKEEMWCPCGCRQWFRFSATNKKECSWSYIKPSKRIGDYAHRLTRIKSKSKSKERSTDTTTTGSDVCSPSPSDDGFPIRHCSPCDTSSDDQVRGIPWHNDDNNIWQPEIPNGFSSRVRAPGSVSSFFELTERCIAEMDDPVIQPRELSNTSIGGKNQELNHSGKSTKSAIAHGYQQHSHSAPSQLQMIDQCQTSVPYVASGPRHPTAEPFRTEKFAEGDSMLEEVGFRRSSSPAPMNTVHIPEQHDQLHHDEQWWIYELENTAAPGTAFSALSPDFSPMNKIREIPVQPQAASAVSLAKPVATERYWPQQNLPTPPPTRTNSSNENFVPALDWQPNPNENIHGNVANLVPILVTSRSHLISAETSQLVEPPNQEFLSPPWLPAALEQNNPPPDYYFHAEGSALQIGTEAPRTHSRDAPATARAVLHLRCPQSGYPVHCPYSTPYDPSHDGSKERANANRRRHIDRKHGGRSWVCMICSKTCTRRDNMRKHYLKAHPGDWDETGAESRWDC